MTVRPGGDNELETDPMAFHLLPRGRQRKLLFRVALRSIAATGFTVAIYFTLPFTRLTEARSISFFVVGLLVLVIVITLEFGAIVRSPYPRLRAVEALAMAGPLFVVISATAHYLVDSSGPESYSEPMSRLDALYFAMTTFATVGFGDIAPRSALARTLTLLQMVFGVLLVGIIAKTLFGVAQEGVDRRHGGASAVRRDTGDGDSVDREGRRRGATGDG